MGYLQLWLSHNQIFSVFFFLWFFHITCLHAQLCSQEQSSALLQFKRHFSFNNSASDICDYYGIHLYSKLMTWKGSSDCCSWEGVECDNETGEVIGLDLSCGWLQGSIHPNSTLFYYFPNLQRLNLAFNDFGKSPIPSAISQFTRLTHLNLSQSRFSGEVPIQVSFLNKLVSLDLAYNYQLRLEKPVFKSLVQNLTNIRELYLYSVIISSVVSRSILNLTSLTHLDLGYCGLHGKLPIGIFHLPRLKELYVSDNDALTGYFPKFLNSSSLLQYLFLGYTNFSGELPDSIGNLKSLKSFDVRPCKFYGSIPVSLANLTQISTLFLSENNFTGTVPSSLSNLENLRILFLEYNNFEGTIVDFLPNSKSLVYLSFSSNNFSGPFPSLIANLTEFVSLDVSNNHLTGPLPSQITGLPYLRWLYLGQNLINGTIPSWVFTLPKLHYLYLGYNKFTGHINEFHSKSLSLIHLSHNNLHGMLPSSIFELGNLTYLMLSSNNFSGSVELDMLCHASFLKMLDLSHNSFSGVVPQCLGNFSNNLFVLDLRKNNFSGTIPPTFAMGNILTTINFNGNGLEGPIPKSLANCKMLEVLDLGSNKFSGKFPYWLENLPNLHVLILRSNKFHGPLPTSTIKFSFPNLRVIDLSNNFFTGPLPKRYFQNFKAMMNVDEANFQLQYLGYGYYYYDSLTIGIKGLTFQMERVLTIFIAIDLSINKFEGEIPRIIGRLNSTRGLNLSHNSLTGNIPITLGNLAMLEWLDLSWNKLAGEIPQHLTHMISLEVLNLSQNQLSGPIPHGNQFDTFSNDSYIGNLALCGPPLSNTCNNPMAPQAPHLMVQQEEDSDSLSGFSWEVILLGYGCGLVFGLVMGYLMFSRGTPQWLVRIIEACERNKVGRRLKRHAHRHRRTN